VRQRFGAGARRPGWRRRAWLLAVVAGPALVGRTLVGEVGSPMRLLRALDDLGDPWADPVAPMISLLALLAETLVAYLLVVLALRSLCQLPGSVGRAAGQVTLLVTPVAVRRVLDLLVGGTLLAQATLAASSGIGMPPGHRAAVPAVAMATSSIPSGPAALVTGHHLGPSATGSARPRQAVMDPAGTRPAPRRSSAPLPPWLGGGPSNPAPGSIGDTEPESTGDVGTGPTGEAARGSAGEAGRTSSDELEPGSGDGAAAGHTVAVGDTLWDIAAAHLGPGEGTVLNVHRYWRQVYRANRRVIGADPDLIHPGTRLDVPPFRRDRP
jgi:hypothetical protein